MTNKFQARWGRLPKRIQVTYFLILVAVAIGVATMVTFLGIGKISPQAATGQASLSLWSGEQNYDIGSVFSVYVQLGADPAEQISKIQIVSLRYDPAIIQVENSGGFYQLVPSTLPDMSVKTSTVEVDGSGTQLGKIDLTFDAMLPSYYTGGSTRLAVINFRALKAGRAVFSFDSYDSATGSGTYIANSVSENILTSAAPWSILLGPSSTPTPTLVTAATSTPTPAPASGSQTSRTRSSSPRTAITPAASPSATSASVNTIEPSEIPSPTDTAVIPSSPVKISGSFSATSIIIYVGIAALVTLLAFLGWRFLKKKKSGKNSDYADDEELI